MKANSYQFYVNPQIDSNFQSGTCSENQIKTWFTTFKDKLSDVVHGEKDYVKLSKRLLLENKKDFLLWDDLLKCGEMTFFADHSPIEGPSIDFCCGYAFWTSYIFGKIDCGVDLFSDSGGYNRTIEGFAKQDFIRNTYRSVLKSDVTGNLPLPSNFFRTVVSVCALEHIERADLALQNMYRILKPGGTLLISLQTDKYIQKFTEIFNSTYVQRFRDDYNMHIDRSWESWKLLIERSGFNIQSTRFYFSKDETAMHALSFWEKPTNPIFNQLQLGKLIREVPEVCEHYFEQVRRWCSTEASADQASLVCFSCTKKK